MSRRAFLLLLVLLAGACVVFAGGQRATGEQAVLKVWDQFMEEGAQVGAATAIEQMGKSFMTRYPNVKVERTPMAVEEMTNTLKPALASGKGPDIFYSEVGVGFVGPILKAGYVMDLTQVWKQRGWEDKLYSMARDIPSVAGVVYGIGHELEFVPVYYNKNIFRQVGLPLGQPKTLADLEAGAAKLKAAGYIPLGWGAKDWWYQSNFTTSMLWAFVDKQKVMDGMYRDGSWRLPEVKEAIETAFVKWAKNDWYIPNPSAIGWNEINMVFAQQKSATHITGSWDIDFYQKNIKDFEIGAFQFPPVRAGKPFQTVSFCGSGYLINAKTTVAEAAVDYLDYVMATEETAEIWVEVANKIPPYRKEIAGLQVSPQLKETLGALAGSDTTPGLSMTVPPEVMSFLQKSAAMVLTGQLTSDQWVDEFQKLWDKSKAEGLTLGTFKL